MRYVVLGSSASLPTKERNGPGGLLICDSERAIIDCGEGTTRQLLTLGHALQKISFVWISHSHLDHYIGLANFLWCLDLISARVSIPVFGEEETIKDIENLVKLCKLRSVTAELHVIQEGVFRETDRLIWQSFRLRHTVPTLGLILEEKPSRSFIPERAEELGIPAGPARAQLASGKAVVLPDGRKIEPEQVLDSSRPGRKVVYVSDTEIFEGLIKFCRGADLLICESTYTAEDLQLAKKFKHMTTKDAASLARDAGTRQLLLTHVSPRENALDIEKEAKALFESSQVAEDLASFDVPAHS
jgi:ribonuclease Z